MSEDGAGTGPGASKRGWKTLVPWLITIVCFGYLYTRLAGAAGQYGGRAAPGRSGWRGGRYLTAACGGVGADLKAGQG